MISHCRTGSQMIEIQDLVEAYDGFRAVDGLSLRVEPGEILGLPNGAGKTTTLRCLAGIIFGGGLWDQLDPSGEILGAGGSS